MNTIVLQNICTKHSECQYDVMNKRTNVRLVIEVRGKDEWRSVKYFSHELQKR